MTEESLRYISDVLKGKIPQGAPDWYEMNGFLACHRIAGLFYGRAEALSLSLPPNINKILRETFFRQKRKVCFMREQIKDISENLLRRRAEHVFVKGSVLTNVPFGNIDLYADGERISEDIDLLVKPTGIAAVSEALKEMGFVQGRFDARQNTIEPFSRSEILMRRMNRGEVAPFIRLTGNKEFPTIEVDINFSLGNTPDAEKELLWEMLDASVLLDGNVRISTLTSALFFIHLVMHQYKESCLHFMIVRHKDLDLYKLADMYYLLTAHAFDKTAVAACIRKYRLEKQAGAVLYQVGEVFDDDTIRNMAKIYGCEQPDIVDYDSGKKYVWTADIRTRLLTFASEKFLKEAVHGG